MPEPSRQGRLRLGACLGLVSLGLLFTGFGALVGDPMRTVHELNGVVLRATGAHAESFRAADGGRLSVWVLGPLSAERPVVLLHGLGATSDYWTRAALSLRRAGRTVLLPDAPGSGASDAPRDETGYGLRGRVAALSAMASALGLDRFDLVGHSLGGWVAGRYAIESPERVARLVLVDAAGFTRPTPEGILDARRSLSPLDRAGARHLVDLLFFRKPFPLAGFVVDALGRNYGARNVVHTVASLGEADALLGRETLLPHATVFLWGERDPLFPVADARRAASRVPGARCIVITGVGHDAPLEAPGLFDQALTRALEAVPTEGLPPRKS
ncbi:MAG: alpha/beta hydrolase [Thermoanaerobaculia bacterium]